MTFDALHILIFSVSSQLSERKKNIGSTCRLIVIILPFSNLEHTISLAEFICKLPFDWPQHLAQLLTPANSCTQRSAGAEFLTKSCINFYVILKLTVELKPLCMLCIFRSE